MWLTLRKCFPAFGYELWFFLAIPAVYLCAALRNVFRPRIVPLIFKVLLLGIVYTILMLVVLVLFMVVSVAVMNPSA